MSDYISKSALIENIKAEIQCVEKEKQQYFEQGNFHNGNILVERIQAMKLVMKIVANEPTLDEKEIIRKTVERIIEKFKHEEQEYNELRKFHKENGTKSMECLYIGKIGAFKDAIEICKEEGGIE